MKIFVLFLFAAVTLFFNAPSLALSTKKTKVVYADKAEQKYEGYVVRPNNKKSYPGVLMIHNWKGVTDETLFQAERIAEMGYVVFTADIYGAGVRPADAKLAGAEAGKYKANRKLFRERLQLGLDELLKQPNLKADKIAAAGYCFGGTGAIELARSGANIQSALSFHCGLDSPSPVDGKNIKAKLIAFHGADDPFVSAKDFEAFMKEMKDNGIDYQVVQFGGAVHSFTEKAAGNDPSKGAAYDEKADKRSLEMTKSFLAETLK